MPCPARTLLALAALALLAAPARAAVNVACEGLTGVTNCVECSLPAGATKHTCYM